MIVHADSKGNNLECVGIRTTDPELATESYRAFSPKSEIRIFRWGGSDFLFGFGVGRLPHMSLIRFRMRNAGIARNSNGSREHISATIPLRNAIVRLGATNNGSIGPGMMRQYRANEAFDAGFPNSDVFTLMFQQQWADDIACNLANDIVDPLETARLVSSRDGYGASLLRLITYSWRELSGNLKHPAAMKQMEEHLVTLFWLSIMADDDTAACEVRSVPNYLRRAEEFIAANLTNPPSLDKIARVADVSVSTLTRSFQRRYGVSPMAFMKQRRLEMVRGQLLTARDEGKTVTVIATKYGFFHLGQFAVDYRKMFGELPSETLRHR